MPNAVQNIAVDDKGYFVGWKTDTRQYHFAVHLLLQPQFNTPSRCFFFNSLEEANKAKDEISSKYIKEAQRVEICKVQHDLLSSAYFPR